LNAPRSTSTVPLLSTNPRLHSAVTSLKPDAKPTRRFLTTLFVNEFTRFLWLIRCRYADMCIVLTLTITAARSVGYIQMKISGCASPIEENNLHQAKRYRATVTSYFKTVTDHASSFLYVQNEHTPLTMAK